MICMPMTLYQSRVIGNLSTSVYGCSALPDIEQRQTRISEA